MKRCCELEECCECCKACTPTELQTLDYEICDLLTNTWRSAEQFQERFKEELRRKLSSLKKEDPKLFDDFIMHFLNEYNLKDYEMLSKYIPE